MGADDVMQRVLSLRGQLNALGVARLALFGSVMRGEANSGSDIDILIELPSPSGLTQLANIRQVIEDAVGRPVDLGTVASLKPEVRASVMAEARYVF